MEEHSRSRSIQERLLALDETISKIVAAPNQQAMFSAIVEGAISLTNAENGFLYLLEEDTKRLNLVAQKGHDDTGVKALSQKAEDSLISSVVQNKKPINLSDSNVLTGRLAKALLCVPLVAKKRPLGAIYVDRQDNTSEFDDSDQALLSSLASLVSIEIENFYLLKEERERAQALSGLHALSRDQLSEYDPDVLLSKIAKKAREVLGADIVTLYEFDERKQDVRMPPVISGHLESKDILLVRGRLHAESLVFRMLERRAPFYATNAMEDWRSKGLLDDNRHDAKAGFVEREGIKSSAGIPLIVGEGRVGVLFINYRDYHPFSSDSKERIQIFANHAALAIQNNRAISEARRHVNEISALGEVGKTIGAAAPMELEGLLDLIHEQVSRLMDVSSFYIAFYHEEDEVVQFMYAVDDGEQQKLGEGQWEIRRGGNGLTEAVVRQRDSVLLQTENEIYAFLKKRQIEEIGTPAKSWLGAPMIAEQKVLGVIAVQSKTEEYAFDDEHAQVLLTIASQAAIAVQNMRLIRKAEQETKDLARLIESSPLGIIVADKKGLVQQINSAALEILEYEKSEILNTDAKELYANEQTPYEVSRSLSKSERGRILHFPTAVLAKSSGDEAGEEIPILLSATWLYNLEGERVGSAGFFQDMRRIRDTEEALKKAQETAQLIAKVLTLGDPEQTLDSVVKGTLEALSCDSVVLYLYDRINERAVHPPKCAGQFDASDVEPVDRSLLDAALIRIIQHDGPFIADPGEIDAFFQGTASTERLEIKTPVVVPLIAGGMRMGIMLINYMDQHKVEESELRTIQLFADQAAVAIYNAYLYEEALKQQDKTSQFVQDVMHQLVGPLSGMRAHCENLMRGRVTAERGKNILAAIVEQGGMIQRYARNFSFSSRGEQSIFEQSEWNPKSTTERRLVEILINCAKGFQGQAKAKSLKGPSVDEVSFRGFPSLEIDEKLFEITILNLYDNAVKYSFEGAPIEVWGRKSNEGAEIIVTNHGIELPPEEIEMVFERYSRSDKAREREPMGTGIGLFICREIMKLHKGNIRAEPSERSVHGNKVSFVVTLPILEPEKKQQG